MVLTTEQIQELNRQRLRESNRTKATEFEAECEADRQNGWARFIEKHCGLVAVTRHEVFYDCEANRNILEMWIEENGLLVDHASLEEAFANCRDRLAQPIPEAYQRRTDTLESHHMPQLKSFPEPPLVLPYTRSEVLSWAPERLRKEVGKSGRHLAAVNRILAGQN